MTTIKTKSINRIYNQKHIFVITGFLFFAVLQFLFINCKNSGDRNKEPHTIIMGVDDAGDIPNNPGNLIAPMNELGAKFLVHHYNPPKASASQEEYIKNLTSTFERHNLRFLINTEIANNTLEFTDDSGWSWFKGPNNTHRFTFRPKVLKLLNDSRSFDGVVYDEAAHMQINQNWILSPDGKKNSDVPFLGNTDGLSFQQADSLVNENARILVDEIKNYKTPYVVTEHVFPVLFHNFARAGMTITYKQLKESWAPIWAALAMGAALQYNTEMWACLDLWFGGNFPKFPGHTSEELRNNLLFGYWMGNDRMYVENINYNGSLYHSEKGKDGTNQIVLSEHGKVYQWFTKKYLPEHPRAYTFRDVKPTIAIIRFDDTDFGIGPNKMWQLTDRPFGSNTLKFGIASDNWMKIWNLLSQGVIPTPENGISWLSYPPGTPYKSFAPMNGVVVFDQTVKKKHLETLKLAFLTGLLISPETLSSLEQLVATNGLTVVTTPELAPKTINKKYSGTGTQTINIGTTGGSWVVTDNFLDPTVKTKIQPFLGKADEIRYIFASKEVIMRIKENEQLDIFLNDN